MTIWEWDEVQTGFDQFVRFVPMIKVLFAISVGFIWSAYLKISSDRHKLRHKTTELLVQWWQQHTTPMYLILFVTLLCQLSTFRDELAQWDENAPPMATTTENMTNCIETWHRTLSLDDASGTAWIATIASLTPWFCTVTFAVVAIATFFHVRSAHTKSMKCMWDQTNRGATIWILQLPVVYSMTALFSVQMGLKRARDGGCGSVHGDSNDAFFIEAGLSFGDGYEAIALLLFADITMNVIEHVVDKLVTDAESVKIAFSRIEARVDTKLPADDTSRLKRDFHEVAKCNTRVITRLEQMSEKLMHSTWSLSTLGIQYFAFTCLITAVPQIIACQAKVWHWPGTYKAVSKFTRSWSVTFKGCGLLGSCVAIHNMVSIEQNFDKSFLEGFTAKLKFISVKIMVSIVFLQQLILPPLFKLTVERAVVLDASLRIIIFTFISIFNIWAWPLQQDFYQMEAIDIDGMEDLQENLLEDGKLGKMGDQFTHMESMHGAFNRKISGHSTAS